MGIIDRVLGTTKPEAQRPPGASSGPRLSDEQAIERYRYMLQTAPPETIEQAHAEAFARLTPEQRRQALAILAGAAPPHERAAVGEASPDDPGTLGRLATRAEMRRPGFLERTFGTAAGTGGGSSLLGSFAMAFAGTMVAQSLFSTFGGGAAGADAPADDNADPSDQTETAEAAESSDMDAGDMDLGGDGFDI
jgi:hypothetical protein